MERPDSMARRRALELAGSVTATALVAGCLSGDDEGSNGDDDGSNGDNETSSGGNETSSGETAEADGDDERSGENESESENEEPPSTTDPEAWEGVDEIVLSATTSSFEGLEPDPIAGEENPTLVLTEGEEYVLTWENADGQSHNLEIWNDDEAIVGGYSTELMAEENETQSLEIEAAEEMAEYTCEVHADWGKRGDIEIESAD